MSGRSVAYRVVHDGVDVFRRIVVTAKRGQNTYKWPPEVLSLLPSESVFNHSPRISPMLTSDEINFLKSPLGIVLLKLRYSNQPVTVDMIISSTNEGAIIQTLNGCRSGSRCGALSTKCAACYTTVWPWDQYIGSKMYTQRCPHGNPECDHNFVCKQCC